MKIDNRSLLILLLAVHFSGGVYALTPQLIKDTVLIPVKPIKIDENNKSELVARLQPLPEWLRYGVLFGMVFIETGVTEGAARSAPDNSSTKKLLLQLFNVKTADFRIPDPGMSVAGNYISPQMMGRIIRLIFESGLKEFQENPASSGKIKASKKMVAKSQKEMLLEKLNDIKPEVEKSFKEALQKLDEKFSSTSFKSSFKAFTESLVNSLEECNYWGTSASSIYTPNTPLYFLYSFVYKKAESRADLKNFFTGLCFEDLGLKKDLTQYFPQQSLTVDQDDLSTVNPSLSVGWVDEVFELKNLLNYSLDPSKLYVLNHLNFEEFFAAGIVQNWTVANMPPIFEYGRVKSKIFPTVIFIDCFESALRNLCNIFVFESNTQPFNATLLQKYPGTLKSLINFYTNYPGKKVKNETGKEIMAPYTAIDLHDKKLHTEWLDTVLKNNIPYATYNTLYNAKGVLVKNAIDTHKPFTICLPNNSSLLSGKNVNDQGFYEEVVTIDGVKYDAFTLNSGLFGYELVPYAHSFVFLLNYLFGFDFFKDKNIDEEIVKTDFDINYTKLLDQTPLFESILLKSGATKDEFVIVTKKQQKFSIIIEKGRHVFISPVKDKEVKNNQQIELSGARDDNPELLLFLELLFPSWEFVFK